MELAQVRAFLAVAEEMHFGRAAARLHMTQPPLSRQIKELERVVGADLFRRTSRSVRMTPAGEAFRREARLLVAQAEATLAAARGASPEGVGSVAIGFVGAATYRVLPRLAAVLDLHLPRLSVRFMEAMSVAQLEALALGRLDLALMRPSNGVEAFDSRRVLREELAVALPIAHPLAGRRRIEPAALDGEAMIGFSAEAPYMRGLLSDAFRASGVRPRVVQELTQSQAILSLVSAGRGLAIVPEGTRHACFDDVVFRPLRTADGSAFAAAELLAVWNRSPANPAMPRLLGLLPTLSG